MREQTPIEAIILRDVKAKTGLDFVYIGSIPVREKTVADAVLPVLAEWVPVTVDNDHRHALYACFRTPHARKYFDQLIAWWLNEHYDLALSSLTQTISYLLTAPNVERIWKLIKDLPVRPFGYVLFAKLASLPSPVQREARDRILEDLRMERVPAYGMHYIAEINHSEIRAWFKYQSDSPHPHIRAIAKRLGLRGVRLPEGVQYANSPPDRVKEVFSTEVDADDLKPLLTRLAKELNLEIPSLIRNAEFVSSAEIDRWLAAYLRSDTKSSDALWFRREDVDTVEVVVTRESHSESAFQ